MTVLLTLVCLASQNRQLSMKWAWWKVQATVDHCTFLLVDLDGTFRWIIKNVAKKIWFGQKYLKKSKVKKIFFFVLSKSFWLQFLFYNRSWKMSSTSTLTPSTSIFTSVFVTPFLFYFYFSRINLYLPWNIETRRNK